MKSKMEWEKWKVFWKKWSREFGRHGFSLSETALLDLAKDNFVPFGMLGCLDNRQVDTEVILYEQAVRELMTLESVTWLQWMVRQANCAYWSDCDQNTALSHSEYCVFRLHPDWQPPEEPKEAGWAWARKQKHGDIFRVESKKVSITIVSGKCWDKTHCMVVAVYDNDEQCPVLLRVEDELDEKHGWLESLSASNSEIIWPREA